jgi:hypothetical protein
MKQIILENIILNIFKNYVVYYVIITIYKYATLIQKNYLLTFMCFLQTKDTLQIKFVFQLFI